MFEFCIFVYFTFIWIRNVCEEIVTDNSQSCSIFSWWQIDEHWLISDGDRQLQVGGGEDHKLSPHPRPHQHHHLQIVIMVGGNLEIDWKHAGAQAATGSRENFIDFLLWLLDNYWWKYQGWDINNGFMLLWFSDQHLPHEKACDNDE